MKRVSQYRPQRAGNMPAKPPAQTTGTKAPSRPASVAPAATQPPPKIPTADDLVSTSESVSDKDEFPSGNDVNRFRKYDASGKLVAAGFQWQEFNIKVVLAGFCYIPLLMWIAYYFLSNDAGPIQLLLIIALAISIAIYIAGSRFRPKSVIFTTDGTIETPFGFGGYKDKRIGGNHRNIVSIEVGRREHVQMISNDGDTVVITGQELTDITARKVAVQLTKALEEIRRTQMGPEPRTVHFTID